MLSTGSSKARPLTMLQSAVSGQYAGYFSEMRRAFLMEHRRPVYYRLLSDGQLDAHLKAIGTVAKAELDRQIARLKDLYPAFGPNAIRAAAQRIVVNELICC